MCRLLGVPEAEIAAHADTFRRMIGLVRGRIYYSLLSWYDLLALAPGFSSNRRFMEQMMGVKEALPPERWRRGWPRTVAGCAWWTRYGWRGRSPAWLRHHGGCPATSKRFYARLDAALAPGAIPAGGDAPR